MSKRVWEGKLGFYLANAIVFVLMGIGIKGFVLMANSPIPNRDRLVAVLPMIWIAGWYLAVLVHELGHVVVGLASGMNFRQMGVGPIGLSRSAGKFELFLSRRSVWGGFAYMFLPEGGPSAGTLRRCVMGGPIASVALALALGCWFLICQRAPIGQTTVVSAVLLLASSIVMVGPWFPHTTRGSQSDMLLIIRLSKPGPGCDLVLANFQIGMESAMGVRPRDMSEWAIMTPLALATEPLDRTLALLIACSYLSDKGEVTEGRAKLDQAYEIVTRKGLELGLIGDAVKVERAFAAADQDHDLAAAKGILASVDSKAEVLDCGKLITLAVIHAGEGDAKAAQTLDRAEAALRRMHRRLGGNIESGLERINRLRGLPCALP